MTLELQELKQAINDPIVFQRVLELCAGLHVYIPSRYRIHRHRTTIKKEYEEMLLKTTLMKTEIKQILADRYNYTLGYVDHIVTGRL